MQAPVLFESAYSTRTFILNKPKAYNALDQDMINLITPKVAVRHFRLCSLWFVILTSKTRNGTSLNSAKSLCRGVMDPLSVPVAKSKVCQSLRHNCIDPPKLITRTLAGLARFAADPEQQHKAIDYFKSEWVYPFLPERSYVLLITILVDSNWTITSPP